jgi:hypothetical protein
MLGNVVEVGNACGLRNATEDVHPHEIRAGPLVWIREQVKPVRTKVQHQGDDPNHGENAANIYCFHIDIK